MSSLAGHTQHQRRIAGPLQPVDVIVALWFLACQPRDCSCRRISACLGLSKSTVSSATGRLLGLGLLRQDGQILRVDEQALLGCLLYALPLLAPAARDRDGEIRPVLPGADRLAAMIPELAELLDLVNQLRLGPGLPAEEVERVRHQLRQELG